MIFYAIQEILRFWLNKGVDGFRVIKVMHLFEDADLRNEPKERCNVSSMHTSTLSPAEALTHAH